MVSGCWAEVRMEPRRARGPASRAAVDVGGLARHALALHRRNERAQSRQDEKVLSARRRGKRSQDREPQAGGGVTRARSRSSRFPRRWRAPPAGPRPRDRIPARARRRSDVTQAPSTRTPWRAPSQVARRASPREGQRDGGRSVHRQSTTGPQKRLGVTGVRVRVRATGEDPAVGPCVYEEVGWTPVPRSHGVGAIATVNRWRSDRRADGEP
jgi:hypothetical protein